MNHDPAILEGREGKSLGRVVGGSLTHGLEVKLDPSCPVEAVKVGQYVIIEGEQHRFFGLITDVGLASLDPRIPLSPPDVSDPFIGEVLAGTATYGTLHVVPMLALERDAVLGASMPQPAKTVPPHFALVREAAEEDVAAVFGRDDEHHFEIGTPLDMEAVVCLDLAAFVQRSNGVFGKSGTGKTFLTRLLLIGMVQKGAAVNLIFDMHNEYGWAGRSEDPRYPAVKGLKQLFPSQIAVFTLDEESSRRRGVSTDSVVRIGYHEVEPEDIALLRQELNITDRGMDAVHAVAERYGDGWLSAFLDRDRSVDEVRADLPEEFAVGTLRALRTSLRRLERLAFLSEEGKDRSVEGVLEYLDRGVHVVLEFGRYENSTDAYILVANLLTRRIHDRYVRRTEAAQGDRVQAPRPLVITIEEAHKFLNPEVAPSTIFGTIAREMRKYNVTLLVIDQRPSGIYEEVLSQLGTKITCLLDNDRDIDAVLAGAPGRSELRSVLARLESKQQALIFGHALPMPMVVRVREYGSPESYRQFGPTDPQERRRRAERDLRDLFGG